MKKFALVALLVAIAVALTGCSYNKQMFDTNYSFKYAVVMRADGEQLIEIRSWRDFEDGDQIQFTSVDGITYLTHASNVILLSDLEK